MLIRTPKPAPRVVELEDQGQFAGVMHQAEDLRRRAPRQGVDPRQRVRVVIQVRKDGSRTWMDYDEFWSGYWKPTWEGGIPMPSTEDLKEAARSTGARYAKSVIRSTI